VDETEPTSPVIFSDEHAATGCATVECLSDYPDIDWCHLASVTPRWRAESEKLWNQTDDEVAVFGATLSHPDVN
jgi:hypothetical protein